MNIKKTMLKTLQAACLYGLVVGQIQAEVISRTPVDTSPNDPRLAVELSYSNGARAMLVRDQDAPKSYLAIGLPVGSLDNPKAFPGLAHYLEHMVLLSSKNYPEINGISHFLTENGGSYNAYTALDSTVYMLEVDNDALPEALDRLVDILTQPSLDPKYANKERFAVNAEAIRGKDNNFRRRFEVVGQVVNPDHPLAAFHTGNKDTLQDKPNLTLQNALEGFYNAYYAPSQFHLALITNQPLDKLEELVTDKIDTLKAGNPAEAASEPTLYLSNQHNVMVRTKPLGETYSLSVSFEIPNVEAQYTSKPAQLIAYLLDNQMPNTLVPYLKEQGWIQSGSSYASPAFTRTTGEISLYFSLTEKGLKHQDEIISATFAYLNQIRQKGISKQYFDEVKNLLDREFRFQNFQRDIRFAANLVQGMLTYPAGQALVADYLLEEFSPQQVNTLLAQLTLDNAQIWVTSPEEKTDQKTPVLSSRLFGDKNITSNESSLARSC